MTEPIERPPIEWHESERASMRALYTTLEARSRRIGFVRLVCIVVVIVVLALVGLGVVPPRTAWAALAFAIAFAALVVIHDRVDRARDRRDAAARFHERALARHTGVSQTSTPLDGYEVDGSEASRTSKHPYAGDIDIIGAASVYELIAFARTQPGARTLREWLLAAHDPPPIETIRSRQEAARHLSKKPELARSLWIAGAAIGAHPKNAIAFETWALTKEAPVLGGAAAVIAWVWPVITIAALALGSALGWSTLATWGPYFAGVVIGLAMRPRIGRVVAAVVANEGGALAFAEAFDTALSQRGGGALLTKIQEDIDRGRTALRALRLPTRALESMQNEVFRLLVAPIVMAELHAVLALERWRSKHGASSADWFGAYGAMEALASLGLLAHDFPAYAWAELVSDFRFDAKELGHPLVAYAQRVCNDVGPLEAGHALVVTGSNMSGKSTLLRSIGVAAAMATAGGPVCANALVMGRLRLVTSMRVSDSLSEGASRFYAELQRIKLVVDMAASGPGVLFLLDEVLYGTNARERLIGSRATLAWLLEHGALGAVSTHDLALADLGALTDRARNVHFEEQVANGTMSFDYKLREGVVKSSNALRLMRQLGLPVGPDDGEA